MRLMGGLSRRMTALLLVAATLLVAMVAVLVLSQDRADVRAGSHQTPLSAATRNTISRHALKWTTGLYKVLSGVPRVVLVRDLTLNDLLSVGDCPRPYADPADPRYALVVVNADLDLSNLPGMERNHPDPKDRRYRYIMYIVDTGHGIPRLIQQNASPNGGSFRKILDDPSLPDDVAPGSPPGTRQVDTTRKLASCPAFSEYGFPANPNEVLPTVAPDPR